MDWGQVPTVVRREQQRIRFGPDVGGQVCLDDRHQVRRDGHVAGSGVALGRGHREAVRGAHHGALDADDADALVGVEVDVATAQLGQLAEPQRAPGRQQDHRLVPLGHRLGELRQLGQRWPVGSDLALGGRGAPDHARVGADLPVAGSGGQDGAQQPVGSATARVGVLVPNRSCQDRTSSLVIDASGLVPNAGIRCSSSSQR